MVEVNRTGSNLVFELLTNLREREEMPLIQLRNRSPDYEKDSHNVQKHRTSRQKLF